MSKPEQDPAEMDTRAVLATKVKTRPRHQLALRIPHWRAATVRAPRTRRGLVVVLVLALVLCASLARAFWPGGSPAPSQTTTLPAATATPAASPAVTATATPAPGATTDAATALRNVADVAYVDSLISHMTLDEEIGQMIMIGFADTQMSPALQYEIQHYHIGSAVMYAFNIQSGDQLTQLVQGLQSASPIPLLIATDQEGGSVNRLQAIAGNLPSAAAIAAINDPSFARQRGVSDAHALHNLGVNVNFAPVVDVSSDGPLPNDLGGRVFGSTPQQVTSLAGAYLDGLQSSGQVVGTLKHFPGLGYVPVDPHATLYTSTRSLSDLEQIDWAPYKALIATGNVHMVMTTHVVLSSVDPTSPASLSNPVVTGVLRDQLGFNGVVVTDGIYMGALFQSHYATMSDIFLAAIQAGNDIICSTWSIASTDEAVTAISNAVHSGALTKQRIDDSVRRILLLKLQLGLISLPATKPAA